MPRTVESEEVSVVPCKIDNLLTIHHELGARVQVKYVFMSLGVNEDSAGEGQVQTFGLVMGISKLLSGSFYIHGGSPRKDWRPRL